MLTLSEKQKEGSQKEGFSAARRRPVTRRRTPAGVAWRATRERRVTISRINERLVIAIVTIANVRKYTRACEIGHEKHASYVELTEITCV